MTDEPTRQYEDAYLWAPADRVRLEELQEALDSAINTAAAMAASDAPQSMADDSPNDAVREGARLLDEFVTEAKTRARVVRMVALPRKAWRALKAQYPIRMESYTKKDAEGNEETVERPHKVDEIRGFNVESMADALVPESIEFDGSNSARDTFLDGLSEPDFDSLYGAALKVNVGGFTPPKAEFSSQVDRIIAAISNSPDPSD